MCVGIVLGQQPMPMVTPSFQDMEGPNDCKLEVDKASATNKKLCSWDPKGKNTIICDINNNAAPCNGECSNSNNNLARYALCPGSYVCGDDNVFMDQLQTISGNFTEADQLCVYRIIFSEFDPFDNLADL